MFNNILVYLTLLLQEYSRKRFYEKLENTSVEIDTNIDDYTHRIEIAEKVLDVLYKRADKLFDSKLDKINSDKIKFSELLNKVS